MFKKMYFSCSFVLALTVFTFYGCQGASNYFGKYLGALKTYHHGLQGDVYVVDSRTLHIRNFNYDGEGPAGYFYVSNSNTPNENGIKLRDERGSSGPLKSYRKNHITLTLPEGKTVSNIKWFYVWCDEFSVNFGDVKIPKNLEFPKPQKIGKLAGVHAVSSDNVVVVDAQTLLIPSFSYDGEAPDAKFWVGTSSKPSPQGIRVPDENGKEEPLRRYDKKTIVLTLPGDLTVFDIGNFAIWCEAFTVDFGHIEFPTDLNVPPSLKMLGVSPQKFTRSISSHFRLESPYSLYSELPEHHRPATRPPPISITRQSDRRFSSSINPLARAIKIRDIATSSTVNKNNNYGNSSTPNVDSISITETGASGGDNDDALYKNNTTSANLTDSNNSNYTPIFNCTVPHSSNMSASSAPDKESTQPKDETLKDEPELVKTTQNDSSAGQNATSFVTGNQTAATNRSVEAPSRVYLPPKFDPPANKSVESPSRTYLPPKLDGGNISVEAPSRAYPSPKSNTKDGAIEVFQSISTEYQPVINNNAFNPPGSGRYGPSKLHTYKKWNEGKGRGWKNTKYGDKDEDEDYRKESQQWQRQKGSASRMKGVNRGGVKRNQDYSVVPQGSSPVATMIEIETNGAPVTMTDGFQWLAASPFKPPPPSYDSTKVYRTIGSSIVTAGLHNSSIIEKIPSEGFEVTSTASVEQIRSEEVKPTMATSSIAMPIKRSRVSANGKVSSRGVGVKRSRGGKKYRSIDKSKEDRSEVEIGDSTTLYKGETALYKLEEGKGTLGIPTRNLGTDEVLTLNAFDIGGVVSDDKSQVEE